MRVAVGNDLLQVEDPHVYQVLWQNTWDVL